MHPYPFARLYHLTEPKCRIHYPSARSQTNVATPEVRRAAKPSPRNICPGTSVLLRARLESRELFTLSIGATAGSLKRFFGFADKAPANSIQINGVGPESCGV